MTVSDKQSRCSWCGSDPLYVHYHDTEWGVPEWDCRALFEKLILDGFQAGLSWYTILAKRDNFRKAFGGFDPQVIASFTETDINHLLQDKGIVRSRAKIEATITGARIWCDLRDEGYDFSQMLWNFVDGRPLQNCYQDVSDVPAETEISKAMSKELKSHGFKFCGPVIVYAFMQAVGMVNDHPVTCFRHEEVKAMAG